MISLPWLKKFGNSGNSGNSADRLNQTSIGNGSLVQRFRLWSGLILMVFVTSHYINHALGNISIDTMHAMQQWRVWIWRSTPGTALLFGALITHVLLVVWKLVSLKSLRLPIWQWVQVILGLLIPYFLFTHVLAMRYPVQVIGIDVNYQLAFGMIWPGAILAQNFLLLVTWTHACIGLHFWLRFNNWYTKLFSWWVSLAILIPTLALTGWVSAAKQNHTALQILKVEDPEQAQQYFGTIRLIYDQIIPKNTMGLNIILAAGGALVIALVAIQIMQRFKKRVKVDYGNGKIVTSTPGTTILETSRQAGIAHMAVCGGKARCSTCRTLIIEGAQNLAAKTTAEAELLDKLNAESSIRLACQAKINGNVTLRPLVQPQNQQVTAKTGDPLGWGVEREIAILFLDIRGFSRIAEKSLPYDIVFILNSFFGEVSSAVEANNGYVDKFMGDGMMALFGLERGTMEAARDAIQAAIDCEKASRNVSRMLTQHLAEPIKIGIGIHIGEAILGRIGKTTQQETSSRLTAIGDSVNVSARLEQATKEFATPLVLSTEIAQKAGLSNLGQFGKKTKIKVRNISRPVEIIAVSDLKKLESALK